MVEPRGTGAAVIVSGVGAGPRPTGLGTHTSRTTPTQTATAVAAPPTARLSRRERRTGAANRTGFSTKRRVSTASPADTRTAANLSASPSGWPSNAGASTSTGQCHRYHEYDTRPIAPIGDNARTRPHPCVDAAQPAPITSTAPSVGSTAAVPG